MRARLSRSVFAGIHSRREKERGGEREKERQLSPTSFTSGKRSIINLARYRPL